MFLKRGFPFAMVRVEVLAMSEVRLARRCWVYVAEDYEDEVIVV